MAFGSYKLIKKNFAFKYGSDNSNNIGSINLS